jgi:hypothetical protein
MPDAFDDILPLSITNTAKRSGNEWVLPLREAKQAIELASDNGIAILGVESFRIEEGGFRVENYTGYGFDFTGDWPDYMRQNNDAASKFITDNPLGDGYGYILTAASRSEFDALGSKR